MDTEQAWWLRSSCATLTAVEADKIFFPSRGSKPNEAKSFCLGCPTRKECLTEAIVNKSQGFMCGTTDKERWQMKALIVESVRNLKGLMPEDPDRTKRVIYLKVFSPSDHHEWMDKVEPPDALINALDAVGSLDEVWESIPVSLAS